MKLLNINIGIKIDNSKDIAEFIKDIDAGIVAIQEIVRPLEANVAAQFRSKEEIELQLGDVYPYQFFGPLWVAKSINEGEKILYNFGGHVEQGNQILSKYPITEATNEHYYKTYSYVLDWSNWKQEDHGRALQIVELDINGKRLQLLNIHGIWTADKLGDSRTVKECKYVVKAAKRKKIPTIITGDFNLLPETDSMQAINEEFRNLIEEYEIKATRPDFKDEIDEGKNVVDYVFVSEEIQVKDFQVIDSGVSDHLPMLLDFEIA
ncbi:MAG: endonuclease/exonuclease/phosphatase family protein [Patescibacteria group bacterium]|nr:endonuclease/exonuclease/phosphatase family protein [Patescibacteria group bacterium]